MDSIYRHLVSCHRSDAINGQANKNIAILVFVYFIFFFAQYFERNNNNNNSGTSTNTIQHNTTRHNIYINKLFFRRRA